MLMLYLAHLLGYILIFDNIHQIVTLVRKIVICKEYIYIYIYILLKCFVITIVDLHSMENYSCVTLLNFWKTSFIHFDQRI